MFWAHPQGRWRSGLKGRGSLGEPEPQELSPQGESGQNPPFPRKEGWPAAQRGEEPTPARLAPTDQGQSGSGLVVFPPGRVNTKPSPEGIIFVLVLKPRANFDQRGAGSHQPQKTAGLRRKSRGNSRQTRNGKGLSATRDRLQNHQAYCLQIKDSPRNLLKEQGGGNGIT